MNDLQGCGQEWPLECLPPDITPELARLVAKRRLRSPILRPYYSAFRLYGIHYSFWYHPPWYFLSTRTGTPRARKRDWEKTSLPDRVYADKSTVKSVNVNQRKSSQTQGACTLKGTRETLSDNGSIRIEQTRLAHGKRLSRHR
ncbi:unnamed protein product [Dibothriocephalus latus]|uniref:Uncharacterized protein n=1 Tax=Dibothriocephalus latus TaxID=60516 RepID=A0A3P6VCH5_DIBLA|nr:unnamed protein product [Dibothriocephalus latus]